ncbi:hypothetical protein SAMN05216548_105222 [Faunimonas pinastri]|uniref:DUF1674 domain-containing protein n=1 Tax=Faunimonas pinastri TaxID=1855383 RepID=A0A1H9H2B3_9HYPH|nr:DUF1674 domain-containing protein [Faunimonas pinastri]SEQ56387.1 hypothetical protein SAMN05216548_105222 [Faunimonas pinastri]
MTDETAKAGAPAAQSAAGGTGANAGAGETAQRTLSPEAQRALAEAAERRTAEQRPTEEADRPREINGREGPEPVRFGDWEIKGRASDF